MTTKPTGKIPTHATDELYASGSAVGSLTKVEPASGEQVQGYLPGYRLPAQGFNFYIHHILAYVDYLADVAVMNWERPVRADVAASTFDTTYVRASDGTSEMFWAPSFRYWVILGSNTTGRIFVGDHGEFATFNLGSAFKYSFGCEAGSRLVLFNSDAGGAGVSPQYAYSAVSLASMTSSTLPGTVTTDAQANDCVVLANGRVLVVGGGDGNYFCWTSDTDGTAFTRVTVGAKVNAAFNLNRVFVGASGRVFAFTTAPAGSGGDQIWYSDDNGDNWLSVTGLAFENVTDACYSPETNRYYFSTLADGLAITDDPVLGSFTTVETDLETIDSVACFGAIVVMGVTYNSISAIYGLRMSWDGGETWREIHRTPFVSKTASLWVTDQGQFGAKSNGGVYFSLKAAGH